MHYSTSTGTTDTTLTPTLYFLFFFHYSTNYKGVELTKTMKPLAGRSSYMQQEKTDGTEEVLSLVLLLLVLLVAFMLRSDVGT